VRVGIGHGARDAAAAGRAGWVALGLSVGFAVVMGIVFIATTRPLIGLFLDLRDPANAEVLRLGIAFLSVAALFQIVDGVQAVAAGALRGLHDTRWPMVYAAIGYWVIGLGTGMALAFPLEMGGLGIWLGLATGLTAVAVLMLERWVRRGALGLTPLPD